MQYDKLYPFVSSKLENQLAPHITYHNLHHTQSVIKNAIYLGVHEKVKKSFKCEKIGAISLKNKTQEVIIYEVIS